MNHTRRLAIAAGLSFIAADVAGPLFFVFTGGLGTGSAYLEAVPTHVAQVGLGALSVFAMGLAGMGIVAALYPVLRAYNEALAIGSVLLRGVAEGFAFLQAALTQATIATATAGSLGLTTMLIDLRDQLGLVAVTAFGIAALVYCWVLYASRRLPRWLAGWGVLGATAWIAGAAWAFVSHNTDGGLAMAPLALNELAMAAWLIVRGFSTPTAATRPLSGPMPVAA